MKISDNNCREFVNIISSKEPVPGGGGAAALCGAVGCALGHMVGALTVGKKKYEQAEGQMLQMMEQCETIQSRLLELIDEDAACFEPLAGAYRLPDGTDEEREHKAAVLEQCSKDACTVPFEIMRLCCNAIGLAEEFALKGSRLALSDAGCAAALLKGALEAASLNVFINIKGLKDRKFAEDAKNRADAMLDAYCKKAEGIFLSVSGSLAS